MQDTRAHELVTRIKTDLVVAMKKRATTEVSALRALLARISNAEAVPPPDKSPIASSRVAAAGVGSTEMPRKQLSYTDLQAVIQAEINEIQTAKQQLPETDPYAIELNQKLAILQSYQHPK
jgi:uncharacterized protein